MGDRSPLLFSTSSFIVLATIAAASAQSAPDDAEHRTEILARARYYSAFDGEHSYRIPLLPDVTPDSEDPIDPGSIVWHYDPKQLELSPDPDAQTAILATTKAPGETTLQVSAQTLSGQSVYDSAVIEVSEGDPALWELADREFSNTDADWTSLPLSAACTELLPPTTYPETEGPCQSCHSHGAAITTRFTAQIANFDDAALTSLISRGDFPEGYVWNAPFTRNIRDADLRSCLLQNSHAWEFSEEHARGFVLKVRSELPFESVPPPSP
jgi:hypothetical protein